jgi:hypothetical protein
MYPKLAALPRAQNPTADAVRTSPNGYSLQWLTERSGFGDYAAELKQLQDRSSFDNISVRPDWRATVSRPTGWADKLLLLRRDGVLEAAVFLREKLALGIRTGYFQGASTLGDTLVLCEAGSKTLYLSLISELLLTRDRGFLLLLQCPAEELQDLDLPPQLQQQSTGSLLHWELPLKPTLEATIAAFSHRTRRNVRSYLRRVDALGWRFHPHLDSETRNSAVRDLARRCTHPFSLQQAEERINVASNTAGCFSMGLTDQNGQWLCCLVGRRTPRATEIFWQLNAAGCRKVSLCVAMRALMIREEIRRQSPMVRYIGGTCALSLPSEARYRSIARPGLRLALLKTLVGFGLLRAPVLRELL